jgi:NAD(P)-dependent dehydrogenase (short-subunit alcohol dehydrogenase family)
MQGRQHDAMKILLIGATGDVGRAILQELGGRHQIIHASRTAADSDRVDLQASQTIHWLLEHHEGADALVVAAGESHFGPVDRMTSEAFRQGLEGKLLGQIDAVLSAQHHLADAGSITLTSGLIGEACIRYGACAAAVNGAIEAFVRSAAAEMKRGLRLNAVSPGLVEASASRIGQYFRGFDPIPASRVGRAYVRSIEGIETGQIYCVR